MAQEALKAYRRDRKVGHMVVQQMKVAPDLSEADLEEFFGSTSDFPGTLRGKIH